MNDRTRVAQQQEKQAARSDTPEGMLMPPVDVFEEGTGITMYADLPGVPKDRLHLHVEADTLTLEGEVALDIPEDMEATHAEVSMPRYHRVFTLSRELDTEKVSAEFRNGVLKLHIPKAEHAQPRRIEVQVA
ncbi:putative heat shock protein [Thioalkalivibrio nitratireducens DSM 14787]|uniref:Heat shock protein n=1 Tax=Thioalkalivibrio nitratireducens (strain DSM 14787 / UNIQEM 213 / ALEN2) TaxID=1255043 RepID=L0DXS0_THIND|nr:Hsp20/alpha crystallin family protein [Thioalkalivibrio nitratireducens]AGA33171.1 putative heat shock protein [Thioalkalivibrio nitratireducens DSM 14787]